MASVLTPVIMIIFNRPDLTERLFREIARARPAKLLVIADGPRAGRAGEAEKVVETRKIIDLVDWDCEVLKCYSDVNLGCKRRVSSGISWAFEQVEEAIILEDDCIPDPSLFPYFDELLARYRSDSRVMMLAGSCFLGEAAPRDQSYYASDLPLIWGWATWRRAWKKYDLEMRGWPELRVSPEFRRIFASATPRNHYRNQLDRVYSGSIDTWDLQWTYTVWKSGGVSFSPTKNLVQNLGFGPEATHTHHYDPAFDPPVRQMEFPLRHPADANPRPDLDRIWLDRLYSFSAKVRRRLRTYGSRFLGIGR